MQVLQAINNIWLLNRGEINRFEAARNSGLPVIQDNRLAYLPNGNMSRWLPMGTTIQLKGDRAYLEIV